MVKRYLTQKWTMKTVIQSPLGYLSATGGVVNVVSRNGIKKEDLSTVGSAFLKSLYGCTKSKNDFIGGQLYYERSLLSPSEALMLLSYINGKIWLCQSLTVMECVHSTVDMNYPLWV